MLRLLIVDDEPYTVDGLYEMLSEVTDLELDIYRAYSAEEAIQRMSRTKMDVVLSDIRMPEMDGIELQRWIYAHWPRCKVIFLTGVSDIQYAQKVLRGGGLDYILKTEGDEAIVRSIHQAASALNEEYRNEQFLVRAKEQLREAQPILQKEWFTGILDPVYQAEEWKNARLNELGIPLNSEEELVLICGRIDHWRDEFSVSDQILMLYAIQNIAEEYLRKTVIFPVLLDNSHFIWLVQPNQLQENMGSSISESVWEETILFVQGTLESIQNTCKGLLKLSVSFVCTGNSIAWEDIPKTYNQLKRTLILGLGNGEEMLITVSKEESGASSPDVSNSVLSRLDMALEMGQEDVFESELTELFSTLPNRFSVYAQAYYSIAVMLLGHINKGEQDENFQDLNLEQMVDQLLNLTSHKTKEMALQFLKSTAAELFKLERLEQDERTHRIIHKLNHYIQEHLNKDLSLAVLAEEVYLNPSYLSSLYKKYTGKNISEYITDLRVDRAKEMLVNSPAKVHEIAVSVGFLTAGYFTRFFKKNVGITPQEYRSNHNNA